MEIARKTLLFSLPIWILLILENYILAVGAVTEFLGWLSLPGMFIVTVLAPGWEQLHNTELHVYLIVNFVIYYIIIYLTLFGKNKFMTRLS